MGGRCKDGIGSIRLGFIGYIWGNIPQSCYKHRFPPCTNPPKLACSELLILLMVVDWINLCIYHCLTAQTILLNVKHWRRFINLWISDSIYTQWKCLQLTWWHNSAWSASRHHLPQWTARFVFRESLASISTCKSAEGCKTQSLQGHLYKIRICTRSRCENVIGGFKGFFLVYHISSVLSNKPLVA